MRLALLCLLVVGCQRTEQKPATTACSRVADTLATFELGTAAKPEQREPVVARYRSSCEASAVTDDEAQCLFKARDTWAARACLPKMFPAKAAGTCETVAQRMREAVLAEAGSSDATRERIGQVSATVKKACEEDGWPETVLNCIAATAPGDMAGWQVCQNSLPKPLQDRLAQRMSDAAQAK